MGVRTLPRRAGAFLAAILAALTGGAAAVLGTCGPFTDVAADAFCPFVLEIFYLGITTGTTATTYDPTANVTRLSMAAFLSRTVDATLKRSSRRAILGQFWSHAEIETPIGGTPTGVVSDGTDVWVCDSTNGTVSRVKGSDGRLLETWTGATAARAVLTVGGLLFVAGATNPGQAYLIDPRQPAGAVTTVATNLGASPKGINLDGTHGWSANTGSVSIITSKATLPWTVTTVTAGFNDMYGPAFDGNNIWVANFDIGTLLKLDAAGAILQTVTVGGNPGFPMYDGSNIWVPNPGNSTASIVRPSTGVILATLTGNGLSQPVSAAFDGQRVLFTSVNSATVSLWKAANLTPLGSFPADGTSLSVASDGINFWIAINNQGDLQRF